MAGASIVLTNDPRRRGIAELHWCPKMSFRRKKRPSEILRWSCFVAAGMACFVLGLLCERTVATFSQRQELPSPMEVGLAAGVDAKLLWKGPRHGERRMVADFEAKSGVVFGGSELVEHYPGLFQRLVKELHDETEVVVVVGGAEEEDEVRRLLIDAGLGEDAVLFSTIPLNSMWVRDYGPLFTVEGGRRVVVVDADYSAIETMAERWRDNDMPLHLAKELGLPANSLPLRIEGGNILCNGEGVGVTSVTVAVRNLERGLEIKEIGALMGRTLGISKWCYVPPLEGEPTGHVDIYLTFLAPDLAVVAECDPEADPVNARRLDDAARVLESMKTSRGPMRVRRVPILRGEDDSWRSFNNVLITDHKLLVPVFADVDPVVQERVLELYCELVPEREVVPIEADELVATGGSLHCISVAVPAGVAVGERLGARSGR